jgi:succinate dehydrogenase / fumarate reductase, iron-sulfur subunit
MEPGEIQDCTNAQNCVKASPRDIPSTESLAEMNRTAWKQALVGWLIG